MSPGHSQKEETDRQMMLRALALARRGEGRVEPNPMVGCVIARRGRVIGEGFHRRFGGAHAEAAALRSCRVSPRGADVYVSLEPCCHLGKTPPCTDALVAAGVGRIVVALRDPHPLVRGRGLRAMRRAGIRVETGLLRDEAAEVLAPYLARQLLDRPYVIAKWAQSLDGRLATFSGDSRWISGQVSRRHVHRLRARVDAIVVGSDTVRTDDPMLTARDVVVRRPALRVVLDTRLRTSPTCRLVRTANAVSTMIMTSASRARSPKARTLARHGVEVVGCAVAGHRLKIEACLRELAHRDVTNLLVEGGASVLTSFLGAGLIDEAIVFVAPKLIGNRRAPSVMTDIGAGAIDEAIRPHRVEIRRSGEDVRFRLRLTRPPTRASG